MSAAGPDPRILVVDDDDEIAALVCHILRDQGYVVEAVPDGPSAVASVRQDPPDLVLLDLILPGTDGWAVLEELRRQSLAPVVVGLTALDNYETFKGFVREGVAGYLGKPFRFQDLLDICRRLLDSRGRPPVPPEQERRRTARRQLVVGASVVAQTASSAGTGEIVDLSPTGAYVCLPTALPVGERVRVAFHVSGGPSSGYTGLVRWCAREPAGFAHGLEFVDLTTEETQQLHELLDPMG